MLNKIIIAGLIILAMPIQIVHAICLQNCTQTDVAAQTDASVGYMADEVQYRDRSHNTGDVKNSVMGDVNIRVGHERLDIRMDSKSKDNFVDASVSSTIILGDMKQ